MRITYMERSLYCNWYEKEIIDNVKKITFSYDGKQVIAYLENGETKWIDASCLVSIEQ